MTCRVWVERIYQQPRDGRSPSPQERAFPGFAHGFVDLTDRPMFAIATRPLWMISERSDMETQPVPAGGKPAYRVPSMGEINALPWNGYTAVSTFSGAGGSSLGYRMAGFRVAWASEFVDAAVDTYRANASPSTIIDIRDIRDVQPQDIFDATGLGKGEIDLFDGSPPCSAFSTAGKREKGWGQVNPYSDTQQRSDDLFFEYARLVEGVQPRVFVAENVSGLVKGVAKGHFKIILARLRESGYRVEAQLLNAAWLGVPQARQRLIFIGVREDLGLGPVFPKPLPYQYTVRDALPWIGAEDGDDEFRRLIHDTSGAESVGEVVGIKTARGVIPADQPAPTVLTHGRAYGQSEMALVQNGGTPVTHDPETGADITLERYALAKLWEETASGTSHPQRFNLARPDPDKPLPTIVQRGGDVSTASVTHWSECRKLTLGELRRLGGFPDDFVLTGTYAQRWERIGRAVPPVMMSHVATVIRDQILARIP